MARVRQQRRQKRRRVNRRAVAARQVETRGRNIAAPDQRNGWLELLQLLHGNRRIFLEETRGAPAGVAAGLGHHGGMAKSWSAAGSRSARNRQGVRKPPAFAARSR